MFVNYAPEVGLYLFTQYMRLLFWWYFIVHTIIEKKLAFCIVDWVIILNLIRLIVYIHFTFVMPANNSNSN